MYCECVNVSVCCLSTCDLSCRLIGEESAAAAGAIPALDAAMPTWVVDPIDGTQNFVHGLPLSCVSIGLCVGGRPTLGVVYDPHREELFIGVAEQAAAGGTQIII